ncbi:MAG: rod shape-determining protein MreD [Syntrophobacteraceae bacterium]|nr:rod shape-determining protein MreD [Syntrophobacteraceae bacterium]
MAVYTILVFLAQAVWISRLPYQAIRVDLMLPLMLGVAMEWSLAAGLLWALAWGFVFDALSGKFWGFHVVSYITAVCLVHISIEKFEFQNPLYQMVVVGACAMGQGVVLWLYLLVEPQAPTLDAAVWQSLLARSFLMAVVSPLLIYPIGRWGSGSA